MSKLSDLPNISSVIAAELIRAGINSPELLMKTGSKKAFMQIREKNSTACECMLCALEGAVEGVRWYSLPEQVKKDLKEFYTTL